MEKVIIFDLDATLVKAAHLNEEVISLLKHLKNDQFKLALITSKSLTYIHSILNRVNAKDYFNIIKGIEDNKTKSECIHDICMELDASFIVVGDEFADFKAARNNQLICIGVNGELEIKLADYTVNNMSKVRDLLIKLFLFKQIEKNIKEQETAFVIGVNGVDTSGKSYFARDLAYYLETRGYKVQIIHMDDFHNPSHIRHQGSNPVDSYLDYAFNLTLLKEVLKDIFSKKEIVKTLHLLNLDTDKYTNEKHYDIDSNTIVIIEGVLLFREPIIKYIDLKIYLDITFEEVLKRAAIRDTPKFGSEFLKKYHQKYIPIQKKYLEINQPKIICDIVIDNMNYNRPKVIKIQKLKTSRLYITPFDDLDVDFLFHLNNDVMVKMYLSFDQYSKERCENTIKEWQKKYQDSSIYNVYKVLLQKTKVKIGLVFLININKYEAEIGYRFLPDFWHHGYAQESVKKLIAETFSINPMKNIIAETHPDNQKSIEFLKKMKFREIANHHKFKGRVFCLKNDL